jgi:N4-gp56 family major capsid protein
MATTNFGVNSPQAVKLWSRKLFREALKRTWFYKFMGKGSDSLIQIAEDTSKGPGDRVRVTLRMLLSGAGISGDGTLEGNEESLSVYSDDVLIDQLRHAVRSGGKMSEQRIPFSVREEARQGLTDWWADRIDAWCMNQLAANAAVNDTKYTGNQAITAADSNHIFYGAVGSGHTDQGLVISSGASASNSLKLNMIDNLVMRAKTLSPQIRPIRANGKDHYVMFIHPEQVYDLRNDGLSANGTVTSWSDIQRAAVQGGQVENNPLFTGALGVYNGVILHESTRVPRTFTSSATITGGRVAVFCGAQAGTVAFGRGFGPGRMSWVEELFDYKNQLGVSAGLIAGVKKNVFNSADFGVLTQVTSVTNGT